MDRMSPLATMSPLDCLAASYDGPIPAEARAEAEAEHRAWLARRAAAKPRPSTPRIRRARWKAEAAAACMAEDIVAVHEARDGQVEQRDLVARGWTWEEVRKFGAAAKLLARPMLRAERDYGRECAA